MPRVSVVVPIYQVERYVAACLQSLARQTFTDLEVIMVDDGSTDRSARIAERFGECDDRFRLLRQPNGGLGNARNTGIAAAGGEFLAFVDADDVVPDDAYARMVRALDRSGSDFATGNVQRLTHLGPTQAQFVAAAFGRTRLRTHLTRFRPLLADRTVWNKLWRRTFWDAHAGRFPEGVVHEDIPVVLPAHLAARRVDVLAAPVYRWRIREDGGESITQRRLEIGVLRDRLAAVEQVRAYFAEHGSGRLCRWYDASLLADDLRRHLVLLGEADAEYRAVFIEGARRVLDGGSLRMLSGLKAIDRLKWHLIARGLEDELLEVLRFERERRAETPPVRRRGRLYGDYPFRTDPRLKIPLSVFRLGRDDAELSLSVKLDDVRRAGDRVLVRGHAHLPAAREGGATAPRITMLMLGPGRWQALRIRTRARRIPTTLLEQSSSAFEATIDPVALCGRRGWRERRWRVFVYTRVGRRRRRRGQFEVDPALIGSIDLPTPARVQARATITSGGTMSLEVRRSWARLEHASLDAAGSLGVAVTIYHCEGTPTLRLKRRSDALELSYPLEPAARSNECRAAARIALPDLLDAAPSLESLASEDHSGDVWDLSVDCGASVLPVALPKEDGECSWRTRAGSLALIRSRRGNAALETHRPAGENRGADRSPMPTRRRSPPRARPSGVGAVLRP